MIVATARGCGRRNARPATSQDSRAAHRDRSLGGGKGDQQGVGPADRPAARCAWYSRPRAAALPIRRPSAHRGRVGLGDWGCAAGDCGSVCVATASGGLEATPRNRAAACHRVKPQVASAAPASSSNSPKRGLRVQLRCASRSRAHVARDLSHSRAARASRAASLGCVGNFDRFQPAPAGICGGTADCGNA